jgi:hypothetical protein
LAIVSQVEIDAICSLGERGGYGANLRLADFDWSGNPGLARV